MPSAWSAVWSEIVDWAADRSDDETFRLSAAQIRAIDSNHKEELHAAKVNGRIHEGVPAMTKKLRNEQLNAALSAHTPRAELNGAIPVHEESTPGNAFDVVRGAMRDLARRSYDEGYKLGREHGRKAGVQSLFVKESAPEFPSSSEHVTLDERVRRLEELVGTIDRMQREQSKALLDLRGGVAKADRDATFALARIGEISGTLR